MAEVLQRLVLDRAIGLDLRERKNTILCYEGDGIENILI
jgi:hypothetical protein